MAKKSVKTKSENSVPNLVTEKPVKSALVKRAMKTILSSLYDSPEARDMDSLRVYLTQTTCLTLDEIDAALIKLIKSKLIVGNEKKGWIPSERHALFEGVVIGSRSGNYQIENTATGELFVLNATEYVPVIPGDTVVASPTSAVEKELRVANAEEVLSRGKTEFVCRLLGYAPVDGMLAVIPVDPYSPTPIYVKARENKLKNRVFTVEINKTAERFPGNYCGIVGRIKEVLGDVNDADVELEVAVRNFELPCEFSKGTQEEIAKLPDDPDTSEVQGRVDLRDIAFVTIDGEDARDFDDAVYAKKVRGGYRLLVAIADVSHYVTEGSALDRDAQLRATSVYFPRRVIPMLPEKLSNGLCSLNPGVDRATLVCDMVLTSDGTVKAYQFYPAMIHSHARLTYTSVYQALTGDAQDLLSRGGNLKDIELFYELYQALAQARKIRGAINFESAETQIVCSAEDGHIEAIRKREHNDAHRMIEEAMLAANTCAADMIIRRKAESLFRIHDAPSADRLENLAATLASFGLHLTGGTKPKAGDYNALLSKLEGRPEKDIIQMAMLRSMRQAIYSPTNIGHYGLGYEAYTHFTSPIRRYPDLLVHRTIRALLEHQKYSPKLAVSDERLMATHAGRSVSKNAQEIEKKTQTRASEERALWTRFGLMCSAAERRADEASRDVTQWLKCMYMKELLGKTFDATITGVSAVGLYVTLNDLFVEGFVHVSNIGNEYFFFDAGKNTMTGEDSGRCYRLGDQLAVRLIEVDVDGRRIDFEGAHLVKMRYYDNDWEYEAVKPRKRRK